MKLHPKQTLITCITAALLLSGCTAAAPQNTVEPTPQTTKTPVSLQTEKPIDVDDMAQQVLSEKEELELLSQFWNEACVGNIVITPCGEDFSQYSQEYWRLSSLYLESKTASEGKEPVHDANGVAYYPRDDYVQTLQSMFGEDCDYNASLPDEPGPADGTLLVCTGYDFGYAVAVLDQDSFSLQGEKIAVDAELLWREPGFTQEQGTLHYEFMVQPGNPYSRYRFVSLHGDEIP